MRVFKCSPDEAAVQNALRYQALFQELFNISQPPTPVYQQCIGSKELSDWYYDEENGCIRYINSGQPAGPLRSALETRLQQALGSIDTEGRLFFNSTPHKGDDSDISIPLENLDFLQAHHIQVDLSDIAEPDQAALPDPSAKLIHTMKAISGVPDWCSWSSRVRKREGRPPAIGAGNRPSLFMGTQFLYKDFGTLDSDVFQKALDAYAEKHGLKNHLEFASSSTDGLLTTYRSGLLIHAENREELEQTIATIAQDPQAFRDIVKEALLAANPDRIYMGFFAFSDMETRLLISRIDNHLLDTLRGNKPDISEPGSSPINKLRVIADQYDTMQAFLDRLIDCASEEKNPDDQTNLIAWLQAYCAHAPALTSYIREKWAEKNPTLGLLQPAFTIPDEDRTIRGTIHSAPPQINIQLPPGS